MTRHPIQFGKSSNRADNLSLMAFFGDEVWTTNGDLNIKQGKFTLLLKGETDSLGSRTATSFVRSKALRFVRE